MKAYDAYICIQCDEILDKNDLKKTNGACNSCTSKALIHLSNFYKPITSTEHIIQKRKNEEIIKEEK